MDLYFEPQAEPFKIEVGFFDTILQIKQQIEKDKGIPVSMQTLIFNGETLADDADVGKCALHHDSNVRLLIAADFFKNQPVNTEEFSPAPSTVKLHVGVKTPSSYQIRTLQMDANDTVLKLKERIQEIESVPMNNSLVVHLLGKELQDNQMLVDCEIFEHSVIDVSLRPLPVPVPVKGIGNNNDGGGGVSRKLRVMVQSMCGKRKIPMEVNPSDKVGELRKELQRLNQQGGQLPFRLPSEGYLFICGQNVLDEDKSFLWYQVARGDTIRMIKGRDAAGRSR
ncbi:hypothetical protein QN277_005339 [Acacia crassicarpa]|uniref:Ubiquitin-like domain-containing protein n=1 Tax=Acacia crassicarpa TaxID=499986 RepID=A0AAE1IXT3_9FABA|nr:hypothetical protein QN277_005339 [Acacia crassicarpa]